MAEFEDQIAEMLERMIAEARHGGDIITSADEHLATAIAPRIAAAIRAASPTTTSHHESWGLQAALQVLREIPLENPPAVS